MAGRAGVAAVLLSTLAILCLSSAASARPEYAADTGLSCGACHEGGPDDGPLTALGREFRDAGHTLAGAAGTSAASRWFRGLIRYLHLVGAVVWSGAIVYIHLFVKPRRLVKGLPRGEVKLGWASIVVMAATGTLLTIWRIGSMRELWTTTFGIVLLVKHAAFAALVVIAAVVTARLDRLMRRAAEEGCGAGARGRVRFAYDGVLYDATESNLWKDGAHMGRHHAGVDLTDAIADAPHGPEVLDRIRKVGPVPASSGPTLPPAARAFVRLAYVNLGLIAFVLLCVSYWSWGPPLVGSTRGRATVPGAPAGTSAASAECIRCHLEERVQPVQIAEWRESAHADAGIACFECHHAERGEIDAYEHFGQQIATIVSPRDCGRCHERAAAEFAASRHAEGGQILASLDNFLGEVVEGVPAGVSGCRQCHGSVIAVLDDGRLTPDSWPNTGIGRINPDGTHGSCSACHPRHRFAAAVARRPESCGRCHLGPDHPQFEIYRESKHGIAFVEAVDRIALRSRDWRLGTDYTAAPTCVTCHNGATQTAEFTHDVGTRIAWTLRPAVSTRLDNWEARRARMVATCEHCHSPGWVESFFSQYDTAVGLYNRKFAEPAGAIMSDLRRARRLTERQFDEEIEWTYFFLWHHEGRRARHGAAMMGPDYVQWHGFFEVAERFYMELVPEAERLLPGVTDPYLSADEHRWLRGLPDDIRERIETFYRERYHVEPGG
jgi:hydroxylamine dehydrogenase